MKPYITKTCLALGLCQAAWGGNSSSGISSNYINNGVVTVPPVVDARSFLNTGLFDLYTPANASATNIYFENGNSSLPFETQNTLFFTNTTSGTMLGLPGFEFDTGTSTSRHSASSFFNAGYIQGVDGVAPLILEAMFGTKDYYTVPADSQPVASQLLVLATNISNSGAMSVGDCGLLRLTGSNVVDAYATLAAGFVSTVGLTNYVEDTTGLQGQIDIFPEFLGTVNGVIGLAFDGGPYYYLPSPGVYDLFWGVANAYPNVNVATLSEELPYGLTTFFNGDRNPLVDEPFAIPANENAEFSTNAVLYNVNGSNYFYNVVMINTNFSNTNITATVGFGYGGDAFVGEYLNYASLTVPQDNMASAAIVQIAEPVYDVITGQTVTNGIYLIDYGAMLPTGSLCTNASVSDDYSRPNAFALTTVEPPAWPEATLFAEEFAAPYDPTFIYEPGVFTANVEPLDIADYAAQIGRNPADTNGAFSSLVPSNSEAFDILSGLPVSLLDPTNDPARIEINANNLDLTSARLRAEGMVILNATNLIGGGTTAVDWGEANASLGVNNGFLNISNVFPTNFQRIRGDIYAWSGTWTNLQTNAFNGSGPVTNQWIYHVLVLDQNLFGSFSPTVRNLNLTGKSSIVLQDNLNVINKAVINTTNLTIESSNYFSQYAQNFTPATTPFMKNLFINTNGFLGSANLLDIGYNVNQGQAAPAGRSYILNTITNFGQMISPAPLLQSAIFENSGIITANHEGSILIEASNLFLGLAPTNLVPANTTNYLLAGGSVNLSAISIQACGSVISTGQAEQGSLMLNATAQLTDLVSGTPTANTNSVITNHWTVTDGFMMENKPVIGDLFGTEIHTISTNVQYVTHVWAATDWSNNIARGFLNNEVIGRLVLDRQSPGSTLHFSAAGARNAMYVDYLVLTNYAYTNYRTGLVIDPNFTIYFAGANADPEKLQEVYPNLIWVTNFVGPNSTYVVPYLPTNSGLSCLMNSNVATSAEISFWDGIPNLDLLTGPPAYPYLLNDPDNPLIIIPCNSNEINGTYSFACNCTAGSNMTQLLYTNVITTLGHTNASGTNATTMSLVLATLSIATNGQGTITNTNNPRLQQSTLALNTKYTLIAKPASGWVFDYWTMAIQDDATNTNSTPTTPTNITYSYSTNLTFTFVTNTIITANFIPIPFPELEGVYSGLFFETNGVDTDSSGSVSLTLTKTGIFSGKLLMGSTNYTFNSQFTGSGMAQFPAKNGAHSLSVTLQLDLTGLSGQILGDVSNSGAWDAALAADLAPTWTTKNPSPLAGSYTMSLPWDMGTDTNDLGGDSYGAVTVSKLGVLTAAGALSDGAAFSASAPVSQDGQWPFYVYVASTKDAVLGWVTVSNGLSGTNISWNKAASKGPLYPAGFNNLLQLVGSPWQAPAKGVAPLPLTNDAVVLSGGNLPAALSFPVKLEGTLTFETNNLNLTINSSTGTFSGWFEKQGSTKKITISGVVLTNESSARGFFLGADESGAVLLGP